MTNFGLVPFIPWGTSGRVRRSKNIHNKKASTFHETLEVGVKDAVINNLFHIDHHSFSMSETFKKSQVSEFFDVSSGCQWTKNLLNCHLADYTQWRGKWNLGYSECTPISGSSTYDWEVGCPASTLWEGVVVSCRGNLGNVAVPAQ